MNGLSDRLACALSFYCDGEGGEADDWRACATFLVAEVKWPEPEQPPGAVEVDEEAITRAADALKRQWPMLAREDTARQMAKMALLAARRGQQ